MSMSVVNVSEDSKRNQRQGREVEHRSEHRSEPGIPNRCCRLAGPRSWRHSLPSRCPNVPLLRGRFWIHHSAWPPVALDHCHPPDGESSDDIGRSR